MRVGGKRVVVYVLLGLNVYGIDQGFFFFSYLEFYSLMRVILEGFQFFDLFEL